MDLYQSLSGMVEVTLTGADIPRSLEKITSAGITLHRVQQVDEFHIRLTLLRKDYRKLRSIAERSGDTLECINRTGLYWWGRSLLRRPVLLLGIVFFLALVLYLPSRVLFVQIEGNESLPARLILEAAEGCGISFGASRREVRSERVKNALLYAAPDLQWAGVNTYGCVAVISVREKKTTEQTEPVTGVSSIVASREGVILSCTATTGTLLCHPGQAVKAGETLISGYTDCGLTIQVTRASGEIRARTRHDLTLISPSVSIEKRPLEKKYSIWSLIIGKKRINLWKDSGISDTICDRIYEEYYVTLPGGFQLPIGLARDSYTECEAWDVSVEETEAQGRMQRYAEQYVQRQMIAGTIDSGMTVLTQKPGVLCLTGKYICTEMIGKVQWEQIGENNG